MTIAQQERTAAAPHGFDVEVTSGLERFSVQHGELTLTSVFQPIFSLSHMRAVGYEGLLRAHDMLDRPVSPLDVFGEAARVGDVLQLDRLAQTLHLENFKVLGAEREWLFLNVHPGALTDPYLSAALLATLKRLDLPPRRIVLEVLEQRAEDLERLADAVRQFRERGFLIALDDFGAGHSNVERIWQLNPDIVKLDRIMLSHAAHRADMATILPGLVALLHEAGKLVLIEGVETEHEAQMALACNADFVQGFFFGRPNPGAADATHAASCIGELTERYRDQTEAGDAAMRLASRRICAPSNARPSGLRPASRWKKCAGIFSRSITPRAAFCSTRKGGKRAATSCCAPTARRMKRASCRSPTRKARTGCVVRTFAMRSMHLSACMSRVRICRSTRRCRA